MEIPDPHSSPAIKVAGMGKTYGSVEALKGVYLTVPYGAIRGLLGPNGAGKTTLVRLLTTLLRPSFGTASVGGYDVVRESAKLREVIGLAGQYAAVDEKPDRPREPDHGGQALPHGLCRLQETSG